MGKISVKGVLVGNLANVFIFVALVVVVALVDLVIVFVTQGTEGPEHFELSGAALYIVAVLPAVAAIVSGYISALYSRDRSLLHGALSTAAMVAFSLCSDLVDVFPDSEPHVKVPFFLEFVSSYSPPLFGMLGAYLRPLAEPRTVLRWMVALAAMIGVYAAVIGVGAGLLLWWKSAGTFYLFVVFAARFGIMTGIYIAPRDARQSALWVFIGIVVAVPALAFLEAAISGHLRYLNYVAVLLNIVGAIAAYFVDARRLARTAAPTGMDQAL